MANGNCVPPFYEDDYGNCVYQPVDPSLDPTYTGFGTGTFADPEDPSALGQIETFLESQGLTWEDYATDWFDPYTGSSWAEKEGFLRSGAEIDIGQLYDTWDFQSGQLYEDWYGLSGQLGYLGELQTQAGSMWSLMAGEYDPVTGLGGDIGRREYEAGLGWGFTQNELSRIRGGLGESWLSNKEQIALGTRSGLRQAGAAQDVALSSIGFATAGTSAFERMNREIREGYGREIEQGELALSQRYGELGWDPTTGEWGGGQYESGLNAYNTSMAALGFERELGQEKYDNEIDRLQHLIDTGQMTYDQAIASGEWTLGMSATDIGQALEQDIWSTQQGWRDEQQRNLDALLGTNILDPVDCTENPGHPDCVEKIVGIDCSDPANAEHQDCVGGPSPTCEKVQCANGLCADSLAECQGVSVDPEFWVEDGKTCHYDTTGMKQCIEWDLSDWDLGIDLDLDFDLDLD